MSSLLVQILSPVMVSKHVRIADLCQELLDEGHIAFAAAYQFTFITDTEAQKAIAKVVHSGAKILAAKAKILREKFEKKGGLSEEDIKAILAKSQRKGKFNGIQLKNSFIKKYFKDGTSAKDIEEIIDLALTAYFRDKTAEKA